MFEKATRLKLRFETQRGNISTEDVWDLPLTSASCVSLDDLAKSLNKDLKESSEESFVVQKSTTNKTIELKFDIVKHIIKSKLDERDQRRNEAATKEKKEKILGIIAEKEDNTLKNKSVANLKKMLDEL